MAKTDFKSIDEYISTFEGKHAAGLRAIRKAILSAVEEGRCQEMNNADRSSGRNAFVDRDDLTPELVKVFVRRGVSFMPTFRKTELTDAELVSAT